jgi:hypothetical protein
MQESGAEVTIYTHNGGSQTFLVSKDGDIHGTGRCAWDVVGIDGRTTNLHRFVALASPCFSALFVLLHLVQVLSFLPPLIPLTCWYYLKARAPVDT